MEPPSRLSRRIGTPGAVVVGLGSMIGAGVFSAVGPAAAAAGSALLIGLAVAGAVAFCNATSTARLAARYPQSGGAYVYGRQVLGPPWGFMAGWSFVIGKTASCAAIALTFGTYVVPAAPRVFAVALVVAVLVVSWRGVQKTVRTTAAIVVVSVLALAVVVGSSARAADMSRIAFEASVWDVLRAAGLLFFAFAGYARIATLGEEVRDPPRTIGRAIPIALGVTLVVYGVVAVVALAALGPSRLASADAPLAAAAAAGGLSGAGLVVRAGAAVASAGVLLSLLAGASRTVFAMSADGELPRWAAAVHPVHAIPHRALLAVALAVSAVVAVGGLAGAIGFSSFAVLLYYAIANASAWALPRSERSRLTHPVALLGFGGCVLVAVTLPFGSVASGCAVLAFGVLLRLVRPR